MRLEKRAYSYATFGYSFFVLALVFVSAFHGFDFSDEGFYLNSIAHPYEFVFSATQFGFVYHPMFHIVGGDVVLLRLANLLLTLLFSFSLFYALLGSREVKDIYFSPRHTVPSQVVFSLFFSLTVLLSFRFWILTPNYNTLNLQALLLVLIGVFRLSAISRYEFWGCLLVSVGGVLCFMAKPTSAVMLFFIVLLQILLCTKNRLKNLTYIGVSAVLFFLFVVTLISGNPYGFVARLMGGFSYVKAMSSHSVSEIFRIDKISWSHNLIVLFLLTTFVPIIVSFFSTSWQLRTYIIGCILTIGGLYGIAFGFWQPKDLLFAGVIIFGPVIGVLVLILWRTISKKRNLLFAVLASCYSYAYAIGSGNNYWLLVSGASVFVIFGLLYLIFCVEFKKNELRLLIPISIAIQMVFTIVIGLSVLYPYRQQEPLLLQTNKASIGSGVVVVNAEVVRYLNRLKNVFYDFGFKANDPVIDLTGRHPGVLFALNAKPLVHPWILGGYPGSDEFFKLGILQVKCDEIARSWLIVENDGERSISMSVLSDVGLDLNRNYKLVGTVDSALWGHSKVHAQSIYRPQQIDDSELKNCRR